MGLRGGTPGSKWQAEQQELADRHESESIRRALEKVRPGQVADSMTPTPKPQPPTPPQPGPLLMLAEWLEARLERQKHDSMNAHMDAKTGGIWSAFGSVKEVDKEAYVALTLLDPLELRAQATAEAELRGKLEAAEGELRGISAALARIPALPGVSRVDDVYFMLAVLHKTDPQGLEAFKILDAAVTRKATQ